jgi:predicted phage tail protein
MLVSQAATAQSLRVSWDANIDPFTAGYRIFGGTQPGVYSWTVDVGNTTTAPLPPFPPGSSYFFVVRAYNAIGEMGPASNEASIDLGPPGVPTGVSAASTGSRVTLSWGPPGDGAAVGQYLVSVGTGPGAANIVSDAGVGNQLSVSGDLGPGRYFARVRAANTFAPGPFSSEIAFVVGGPDAPGNPSGLVVTWQGTVATFRWNQGVGAANYILEAGSTPGGSNLGAFNMGGATQYSVDVPVGTYYVRVRAANLGGVSGPSNELVVRGPGAPARPGTLTATNTAAAVTLRWSAPSSGAQASGYVLEAGSGPGLANLAVVQLGNQTTYVAAAPPPGTYYVRVRAINARGAGDASNEVIVRR